MRFLLLALLAAIPAFAQFGSNATSLRGQRLCNPLGPPTSGQALAWDDTNKCWAPSTAAGGGGTGTVTSVGFTGGLVSVATATTTPAFTIAGTSGGLPYFDSATTWASSGVLSANRIVLGGGAGAAPTVTAADSTTTHALFATAGAPAFRAVVAGDIPTLNQSTSGNAATATALAANGTNCSAGSYPLGVDASGNVESCTAAATGTVTSIATTGPITGGTITGTGTIACATCGVTGSPLSQFGSTTSAQLLGTLSDATGTGAAVFGTSPTLVTPAITTSATLSNNGITTDTPSHILQNTTAATVGVQQVSPAATWKGNGWKTTATAGSQATQWDAYLLPTQNTTSPDANLVFVPTINGSARTAISLCSPGANGIGTNAPGITFDGSTGCNTGSGFAGIFGVATTNVFAAVTNASVRNNWNNNGMAFPNTSGLMFASGTITNNTTGDVTLDRDAAGVLGVQSGAPGTTAANYRALKASAIYSGGTTFTASGLSVGTLVGGATAGTFALGANGAGTVVVTMGNSATAPTGWNCSASDRTTTTVFLNTTASSTTTATINFPAGAQSGDVIGFSCIGY